MNKNITSLQPGIICSFSVGNIKKQHYTKFMPSAFTIDKLHSHGFTPHIYCSDRTSSKVGHRRKNNVVGMGQVGYIDIDYPAELNNLLKDSNANSEAIDKYIAKLPSEEEIRDALTPLGIWFYIHPSASRKPKKFRIIYNRNIILFHPDYYNPTTHHWDLTTKGQTVIMEDAHIQYQDGSTQRLNGMPLSQVVLTLLEKEMEVVVTAISKVNTNIVESVDSTSLQLHMHSKHLTNDDDTPLPGTIIEGGPLEVWHG